MRNFTITDTNICIRFQNDKKKNINSKTKPPHLVVRRQEKLRSKKNCNNSNSNFGRRQPFSARACQAGKAASNIPPWVNWSLYRTTTAQLMTNRPTIHRCLKTSVERVGREVGCTIHHVLCIYLLEYSSLVVGARKQSRDTYEHRGATPRRWASKTAQACST